MEKWRNDGKKRIPTYTHTHMSLVTRVKHTTTISQRHDFRFGCTIRIWHGQRRTPYNGLSAAHTIDSIKLHNIFMWKKCRVLQLPLWHLFGIFDLWIFVFFFCLHLLCIRNIFKYFLESRHKDAHTHSTQAYTHTRVHFVSLCVSIIPMNL